jgi:hypothetical protein
VESRLLQVPAQIGRQFGAEQRAEYTNGIANTLLRRSNPQTAFFVVYEPLAASLPVFDMKLQCSIDPIPEYGEPYFPTDIWLLDPELCAS